jgi:glycosyltransferase involved in cell wall biosynthesis
MRVGLVSGYMPPHLGGVETIGEILFQGYRVRGLAVRWLSSRAPRGSPGQEGDRVRVPCCNLAEELLGVPVPVWGRRGWAAARALAAWADVLHVLECLYVGNAMAVAAARRRGTPVLLTQNVGLVHYRLPLLDAIQRVAYATLGRAVLRRVSHVVVATPAAEPLVAWLAPGVPPERSSFPIGVDTERFRPPSGAERRAARTRLGLPPDPPVVLFAGRLVEKKGVALALEIAAHLAPARLLVVGDGPLRTLVQAAGDRVTWRPGVGAEQMAAYYHAADCLVLPSHGEGLPLVVQEAMAAGLPVVVSADEPYAAPLVREGVCAGAERTPAAMAAGVRAVLSPAGLDLGRRARRHAEIHWSAGRMVDRCVALLERLRAAAPPVSAAGRREDRP